MAVNTPEDAQIIEKRMKIDVQRELQSSNPFLKIAWLGGLIVSLANRGFEFYQALQAHALELMPDTAVAFAARWAAIWGVEVIPGEYASGIISHDADAGVSIPFGTPYKVGSITYKSTAVQVAAVQAGACSITFSGTTASATYTPGDHQLSSQTIVTISGAIEAGYNGTYPIIVTGDDTFDYEPDNAPGTSPATGSPIATVTRALVPVTADEVGDTSNQGEGVRVELESPIADAEDFGGVVSTTIFGGQDQEEPASLKSRFLFRLQNPVAHFNVADIDFQCKKISGNTRIFVQEVTPSDGQVTVYFMRDDETDPIPTSADVIATKNNLLLIKPAPTSDADVIVAAPTPVDSPFTFTALTPDTPTMRDAIEKNLARFFDDKPNVHGPIIDGTVSEELYRAAITNSIDITNGALVEDFTLSPDPGDLATTVNGEICTLGAVAWP